MVPEVLWSLQPSAKEGLPCTAAKTRRGLEPHGHRLGAHRFPGVPLQEDAAAVRGGRGQAGSGAHPLRAAGGERRHRAPLRAG